MLIGLTGYARTGKDTVAEMLVSNYDFVEVSFADPMRTALIHLNPLIHVGGHVTHLRSAVEKMGWEQLKSLSPDVRPLLQRMGTEVGRHMFGENVWVDMALSNSSTYEDVVFSDVRFTNEADAIRAKGGIIVRVTRPNVGPTNGHISESNMDNYKVDWEIANNSSLDALEGKVAVFIAAMFAWNKND